MSTAARRSLQVEERPRAPIRPPLKTTIRSNGNGHGLSNGIGHASSIGNGLAKPHLKAASSGNGWSGNVASRRPAKPRVFVAAENRLLREALSRMLTKNGDVEVITSEVTERFSTVAQLAAQDSYQKGRASAVTGAGNTGPACNPGCGDPPSLVERKSGAGLGGDSQDSRGQPGAAHSSD